MITRLVKRSVATALKLPFAVAWDCISLGNMGGVASTSRVLREHKKQKQIDKEIEMFGVIRKFEKK